MLKLIGAVLVLLMLAACATNPGDEQATAIAIQGLGIENASLRATITAMQGGTLSPRLVATPSPTSRPTSTPTPASGDICYRTPEVQKAILQELDLRSCQVVTPGELFRVQELSSGGSRAIAAAGLKPGDFADLPNLKYLYLQVGEVPETGVFDGLTGLESLQLELWIAPDDSENERVRLPESMFASLPQLQVLKIETSQNGYLRFQNGTLDGLAHIKALDVRGAEGYTRGALDGLENLQCLTWTLADESNSNREQPRQIPKNWLAKLPNLMTGATGSSDDYCYQTVNHFGLNVPLPSVIELGSLQAAAGFSRYTGDGVAVFVDGERISWLDSSSGPHLLVGDRVIPVSDLLGEWRE